VSAGELMALAGDEVHCPSGCAWCDESAVAVKMSGDYPQWQIYCDHAAGCPITAIPGPNSSVMMRYGWTTARKAINDWEARGPIETPARATLAQASSDAA
jgi:hypothetical protein